MDYLTEYENKVFDKFSSIQKKLSTIFVLGSPRTGSTLTYQLLINLLKGFYFTNFTNYYFHDHPIIGSLLETIFDIGNVDYESDRGKTRGIFGPSEASFIFRSWFGGEHPSQTKSRKIISGRKEHMLKTLFGIYNITGKPIIMKNAWNCFRIKNLLEILPDSKFVWIRRDIVFSALSDLKTKKGNVWNSATTKNYKELMKLPRWEQVVEQQYIYNKVIESDLKYAQYIELWYEDLCDDIDTEIEKLVYFLGKSYVHLSLLPSINCIPKIEDTDYKRILNYVEKKGYERQIYYRTK